MNSTRTIQVFTKVREENCLLSFHLCKAILLIALPFIVEQIPRQNSPHMARSSAPCRLGGRAGCPFGGQNPPSRRCRQIARTCWRRWTRPSGSFSGPCRTGRSFGFCRLLRSGFGREDCRRLVPSSWGRGCSPAPSRGPSE